MYCCHLLVIKYNLSPLNPDYSRKERTKRFKDYLGLVPKKLTCQKLEAKHLNDSGVCGALFKTAQNALLHNESFPKYEFIFTISNIKK